jgi:hypothetical protein
MPGFVPGIHVSALQESRGWPGRCPAMTVKPLRLHVSGLLHQYAQLR